MAANPSMLKYRSVQYGGSVWRRVIVLWICISGSRKMIYTLPFIL
jgi:hypothetical protein